MEFFHDKNIFFFKKVEKKKYILSTRVNEWGVNYSREKKYGTFVCGHKKKP